MLNTKSLRALILFFLLCKLSKASNSDDYWCKDSNGNPVEWFIMYKTPKTSGLKGEKGEQYAYVDSTSKNSNVWELGPDSIFKSNSNPLANSLNALFKRQKKGALEQNTTWIVYNDQPPSYVEGSTGGHTKGVVLFGPQWGIWIVHSVPKFPENLFKAYSFPPNARENGQSIICVTFRADKLNTIARHLRLDYPNIYSSFAPADVQSSNPDLKQLLAGRNIRTQPWIFNDVLTAAKGTSFTAVAKHGRYGKDIYAEMLAPTLKCDLVVQTWRNGAGGKLPPDCQDTYKVLNVAEMKITAGGKVFRFHTEEDHSKWALGDAENWVCIGSINRMESQYKRGGETLCFQNANAHSLLQKSVVSYGPCDIRSRPKTPKAHVAVRTTFTAIES